MFYLNPKSMKNVCGLDVHKDNVFVCIDKENGEKIQFKTGILTKELDALRDTLDANDVTEIAMESNSVYWMPIWRILENHKTAPGRTKHWKSLRHCLRRFLTKSTPRSLIHNWTRRRRRSGAR